MKTFEPPLGSTRHLLSQNRRFYPSPQSLSEPHAMEALPSLKESTSRNLLDIAQAMTALTGFE